MKRVLLVQPLFQPLGGRNAVAAWMLQALRSEYHLSVLSWTPADVESINRFYGTTLRPTDVTPVLPSVVWRQVFERIPRPFLALKLAVLARQCHAIQSRYDVVMSAHSAIDFGRPGIQYIHSPVERQPSLRARGRGEDGLGGLMLAYDAACWWWSGCSWERIRKNLTLVNSEWTQVRARHVYGLDSVVVYPPVPGGFPAVPWAERESGFVCVSRFAEEKRLDSVIDVLAALRARGHAVHLHLVGTSSGAGRGREGLMARTRQHSDWIVVEEDLPRCDIVRLLAAHRYGIHGMVDEHFGIAVAEQVRAGCITFVPDGGGQVEIVGDAARLRYRSVDDAVEKIGAVLRSPSEQDDLRAHLAERAPLFSTQRFMERIRAVVRGFH